ncbi:hypothetical protein LPB19_09240 [Marinobacter salinisoli]|uniref:Uncharacterized protein n=1 Tax=Marinobacter salinisoli TaxID=2769486 RepID=A0ABX7MMN1_9GAMM|nr:hypothetical protein [Marinobacter salinisoli]QSP93414.1 hypothetical protein LPB19_09240 [Marinobacter salinisoli]
MLKELWRRLGTDFASPDCSDSDYEGFRSFGDGGHNSSDRFNVWAQITHTGHFHLERLTGLLQSRYGKSYQLDHQKGRNHRLGELISYAARIQDQDIQRELLLFYLNCSPAVQDFLRSETMLGKGPLLPG